MIFKFHKIIIVLLFCTGILFGWGKTGHRIVGKVANNYLTKNARLQIKKILGHDDLSRVSTWADEIKSDSKWDHAWSWHFCTIPDNEVYIKGAYDGDAIEKIIDFIEVLKNRKSSKDEKKIALKFLVHLIGDVHQPLHVGRKDDKGGNTVKVQWFGEKTNLHSIWDTHMIDHQKLSYTEYTNYLLLDIDYSKIRSWQGDSLMTYINESKQLRDQCYDFSGDNLKWEYFYKNKSLLEQRLLQGGIRLSGELNRIFK